VSLFEPLSPLVGWMLENSYAGLAAVMFLAGSVAPIPWELVLLPAGARGLDPLVAGLWGGLGASAGAVVGYVVGYVGGRPLVVGRWGRVLVSEDGLAAVEGWVGRWGDAATLVTRCVQYMPYKTYNLAAGVLGLGFSRYVVLTVVGTVVRCWYMVYLGNVASLSTESLVFVAVVFLVAFSLPRVLGRSRVAG